MRENQALKGESSNQRDMINMPLFESSLLRPRKSPAYSAMKEQIRVSMGTLRVLGMEILETDADPTTAYLQTYEPGRCSANCAFCSQAREAKSRDWNIARGLYPPRDTDIVVSRLAKAYANNLLRRACIQTMAYAGMQGDLIYLIEKIRAVSEIPLSVSLFPQPAEYMRRLKAAGVDPGCDTP